MHPWLAQRTSQFDSSGIRKVFDLAAKLEDPIDLSIGQPDFPVPDPIKQAAQEAIENNFSGYSVTQGIPALLEKLQNDLDDSWGHADRRVLVTSGTSGGLVLTMLALVDPGDEVICFDPYFVMYPSLTQMVGGTPVIVDTYPDFRIDPAKVEVAITSSTKLILLNSPCNPTGMVASAQDVKALAELAAERGIALVSDEIYREFSYEGSPPSPAQWNPETIVVDGFSKTYGITGWRLGFMHGPTEIIEKLTMLQQYTFVCAPHPLQHAALAALETDMSAHVNSYRDKRDRLVNGLKSAGYELNHPGGAFYVFPQVPNLADGSPQTATEFVTRAIEKQLLIIPGDIFSQRGTHFRLSYAASEETIDRGIGVLAELCPG